MCWSWFHVCVIIYQHGMEDVKIHLEVTCLNPWNLKYKSLISFLNYMFLSFHIKGERT
jgi:hypothetical protein